TRMPKTMRNLRRFQRNACAFLSRCRAKVGRSRRQLRRVAAGSTLEGHNRWGGVCYESVADVRPAGGRWGGRLQLLERRAASERSAFGASGGGRHERDGRRERGARARRRSWREGGGRGSEGSR